MPRRSVKNKTIEVILLQDNKNLWEMYNVIRVKPIYARMVLLPKGIAVLATKETLNKYEQKIKSAEEKSKKMANSFEDLFMKINNDWWITITKKTNKDNILYAQVSSEDIINTIKEIYNLELKSHYIKIKKKIKHTWTYNIVFNYKELKKEFILTVKSENIKNTTEQSKEEKIEEKENTTENKSE